MSHPNHPDGLQCGSICAGHMEGDLARAADRERRMINAAKRRSNWLSRSGWKRSAKGNWAIRTDGYQVTVFPQDSRWSGINVHRETNQKQFLPRRHPTMNAARMAVFDLLFLPPSAEGKRIGRPQTAILVPGPQFLVPQGQCLPVAAVSNSARLETPACGFATTALMFESDV